MDLVRRKIRQQNRDITLILMPLVMIFAKIVHLYLLPDKYYFDSWRMISMLTGQNFMVPWAGYQNTVDFYAKINFLHLSSIKEFSIVIGLVMTPVMMWIISRTKEMEMRECIFALMTVGLLNIYVFSITKEFIQILYFIVIYIIIRLPVNNIIKLLGCAGVFYWESLNFRSYYIIMAAMTVFMYFIFWWLKRRNNITKKHIIITVVLCFLATFIFLYASSFISYDDYIEALNARDGTTDTIEGANTAITNPIKVDSNLGIFMYDYVIVAVRMMLPIELLIKSPVYAPFVIFQFFILYYFLKTLSNIKETDDNMHIVIACFSAYLFGSFIFEPDFGSWARHEAATFPVMQFMALKNSN